MGILRMFVFVLLVLANLLHGNLSLRDKSYYTAAVFEHARFGTHNDLPELVIKTNLNYYTRATKIAKSKGADVIVFPEYGIILEGSRKGLKPFLENVPDPQVEHFNPCEQPHLFAQSPILSRLSCMAKNNSIFVVANMGDIQYCRCDPDCPEDGAWHYNTNVVFDRNGTLVLRYHKEHLFIESGMDLPKQVQNPIFKTDFGTFATFICFDSIFARMSEVARRPDVDGIMFPTMWIDSPPQLASIQYWQSWAYGNKVALLAANLQIPAGGSLGSGIFQGHKGSLAYTFNPDGVSKLVVARVAKSGGLQAPEASSITAITTDGAYNYTEDGRDVPLHCTDIKLKALNKDRIGYRCSENRMVNYTLVKLTADEGHIEACNNGMCCKLDYATNGLKENFYLGVYNNTFNVYNRYFWSEENCVLTRCNPHGNLPCATFPLRSETRFKFVLMSANFTTDTVYPSTIESGMRLVPNSEWKVNPSGDNLFLKSYYAFPKQLLSVGMKGRCYDRDPPFNR